MSEEELEQWLMYLAEQDKLPENTKQQLNI